MSKMQLSSAAFANNRLMPEKYSCRGANINPPLRIKNPPADTKSFAIIVHDPDAPGQDWVHWTVWNLPSSTTEIVEGSLPVGAVEGMTDFGKPGYGGPCPPSGKHRYFFEIYALDTLLDLEPAASRAALESAMEGHVLAKAESIGLFAAK